MNMETEGQVQEPRQGPAFLLVQLGMHVARKFEERLKPLGIAPRHFGLLRSIAAVEGQSQQAIGDKLHIPKPQMVWLIDDLEQQGLVERKRNQRDRRAYALHLTPKGHQALQQASVVAREHEEDVLKSLSPAERRQLAMLLGTVADDQGILGNSLPGRPPSRKNDTD
jgi:DNA-binding MarR family transcriptional regulator